MAPTILEYIEKLLRKQKLMVGLCATTSIVLLLLPVFLGAAASGEKGTWATFLGYFHPMLLHLPIGALLLVFTLEVISFLHRKYTFNMMLPLLFNAGTSVVAAVLGVMWYYGGEYQASETLDSHLWQGLIYAASAVWLPLVYHWTRAKGSFFYYTVLLGSVLIMTSAAHIGGESKHGDIFEKAPWNNTKKKEVPVKTGMDERHTENAVDLVVYTEMIVPILKNKCYSCHHSTEKVKSGLKLDTLADILKGGDCQDFDPTLTPGDASKSLLITSIELPDDDDLHMPPPKKEQITADELAILKWWVNAGASETAKTSELPALELENK